MRDWGMKKNGLDMGGQHMLEMVGTEVEKPGGNGNQIKKIC